MTLKKDGTLSWVYLAVTVVIMLTVQAFNNSSGVLVAILIEEFNESNAKTGWVTSMVFFLMFALCPLVIYVHQSLGFRRSIAIAGLFYIFAFLVTPFMPSLNFIFFTYSIPFGIALSFVCQLTIRTQKEYFEKFYGVALGVRFSGVPIGAVLISFFLPVIYEEFGFKTTFLSLLFFCPVFLIYGIVSRTHLNGSTNHITNNRNIFNTLGIHREFFQDKSFVLCLAGTSAFFLTYFTPLIYMVRYVVTLGYPLSKAKWVLIIRNITTLPARLIVGYLGGIAFRRGKVKMVVQLTYPIFGLASLLCSFVHSFPLLMLYMAFNGLIEAVFWVTLSLYVDEITAGYHSDEAYSLICFISALMCLIGPPAQGWLFDVTGDFRYVFYTVFGVSLIAGFLVFISSFVKVGKESSLLEKSLNKRVVVEEFSESIDDVLPVVCHETAV